MHIVHGGLCSEVRKSAQNPGSPLRRCWTRGQKQMSGQKEVKKKRKKREERWFDTLCTAVFDRSFKPSFFSHWEGIERGGKVSPTFSQEIHTSNMLHSGEERWADNEFAPPAPDLYWERQAPGLFLKRQSLPWVTAPAQTRLSPCGRSIIITENKPERAKETERNRESSVPEAEPGTVGNDELSVWQNETSTY